MQRRLFLCATLPAAFPTRAADADAALTALRSGGVVAVFRHANAPGNFDPPNFRLELCATQRNLDERGRDQARAIGAWFRDHGLKPLAVRSSLWCRCQETARLAFGAALPWPPLNSFIRDRDHAPAQVAAMNEALAKVPAGRFEVWITHQVNMSAFADAYAASGEGFIVRPRPDGAAELIARLPAP